jgi:SpoVK/Ycf46/Vps4 family AAA+-type ATPase
VGTIYDLICFSVKLFSLSEILKILLRDETLATDVSTVNLAKKTEGFSGSDLKRMNSYHHSQVLSSISI